MKKILIILAMMLVSMPALAGNGGKLRRDLIQAGEGWYCTNSGKLDMCHRDLDKCQKITDCDPHPGAAACFSVRNKLDDKYIVDCFPSYRACNLVRNAGLRYHLEDHDNISVCEAVK